MGGPTVTLSPEWRPRFFCLAEPTFAFLPSISDEASVSLKSHWKEKEAGRGKSKEGKEKKKEVNTESEGPGEANCFDFSI